MIKLCGFALSNYYNKVKFVLLEHGIAFEEVFVLPSQEETMLEHSPLGKVPYIQTEHGDLCESQGIVEYLAARFPDKAIFSADPWEAAKERELIMFVDVHLELTARNLYKEAFFGGTVTDATKGRVEKLLEHHIAGFKRIAKFGPYLRGEHFSVADAAGFVSLPLVGMATQTIYGRDFLLDAGVDWKSYVKAINARPAAQRVTDDRKAYIAASRPV
ncbi:glutathione S-transferase [Paraburkholderia sp. SEWSISQ10-3 4]|uniref:glutathione S-transferase family protein n=1 Tax=Paraburkholderia TaxID=1822464 RepID=UPI002259013A|nr:MULTISPECIES: glutathione S-transferase [Paraburkholderia]MCX4139176.1 glutathione S-transferase [Paraburkholderia aspalathi]MDN7171865.1 glutathione S-transferase [Paraburkholderia sp. SEWSISQ10-3 4]MDQ6501504.1 glutathione S-transferase [Paraburkholderia aspalathi]